MPTKPKKPKMPPEVAKFFAATGAKGGAAGSGKSKVRGDSEHYRALARKGHKKVSK